MKPRLFKLPSDLTTRGAPRRARVPQSTSCPRWCTPCASRRHLTPKVCRRQRKRRQRNKPWCSRVSPTEPKPRGSRRAPRRARRRRRWPPGTPVNLPDSDTESASESADDRVVKSNARTPQEVIETLLNEDFPNEGFVKVDQVGVQKALTQNSAPPVNTPDKTTPPLSEQRDPVWVDSDDETVAPDTEAVGT